MEDVAQTGVTALSHTYLHSKTDDLKQTFDEEGQKLLDRFDDEPDAAVNKGGFWSVDTLWTGLVLLAAAGTVCANIFAIILDGSRLSIAAGSFGSAVAVKVAVGELRIEDLDTLRAVQNALRYEVAKFSNENKRLGKSIEDLKVKVFCLNETKQRLKELTQDQNLNVNALVELVHENQRIIDAKKKTLIVGIQQDLMESLLKADNDFSGDFSEREIKRMLNYLRGLPSVKVNEQLIAQAIKNDNCIVSMMNLVRAITKGGNGEGGNMFIIDAEDKKLVNIALVE